MIITLEQGREWLRLDGTDNDAIITSLINTAEQYIQVQTGLDATQLAASPLAQNTAKLLLSLYYNTGVIDPDKLQRTIDAAINTLASLKTQLED
jgi:uncharacterized phage protein (predicted DNA packaging)|nr:MAG TPA: tail connector protein [Caudoviricetes sp.]